MSVWDKAEKAVNSGSVWDRAEATAKPSLAQRAKKFLGEAAESSLAESEIAASPGQIPFKSIGRGIMRGYAKTADTALALADALHEKGSTSPARKLQEKITEPAIKYWTKPNADPLERVGEGVGEIGSAITFGPGAIPVAAGNATYQTGKELLEQGATVPQAQKAGMIQGGAMAAMGAIPAAGKTIPKTVGLATANPVIGVASRAATQEVLEDNPELAKQFDPFDPVALGMDVASAGLAVPAHLKLKAEAAKETPRPTHENLKEGVTAADSLELQNKAPELKPVAKGDVWDMAEQAQQGKLDGKVTHQEGDAVYAIDPNAINPEEAKAAIAKGGDAESEVLGYPTREGLTPEQTADAAVTKQGEVVTDLPTMKAETEAGNVAWAAEGKKGAVEAKAREVAGAIKDRVSHDITPDHADILAQLQGQNYKRNIKSNKGFSTESDFQTTLRDQYPSVAGMDKGEVLEALKIAAGQSNKKLTPYRQQILDAFDYDHKANIARNLDNVPTLDLQPGDTVIKPRDVDGELDQFRVQSNDGQRVVLKDGVTEEHPVDFGESIPGIVEKGQAQPKPLYDGEQSKLFTTPPEFGRKEQGRGVVEENPMLTEMKEREAERQQGGFDFAQRQAAEVLNKTTPETGPAIGMSTRSAVPVSDFVEGLNSVDPRVERRMNAAHGLTDGPTFAERAKAALEQTLKETQHFPELRKVEDARTADILRQYESANNAIKAKTYEYLRGLTTQFGPNKMKVFERKVLLDDLMGEAEKGRELPFGYTPETLAADHSIVSDLVARNPDIQAALERRKTVQAALVDDAIAEGVLPETVRNNPGYYRHMVLEYANAKRWSGLGNVEVRAKKRGWQKARLGSEKDINTNFLEAEYEVTTQTMKEIATARTLKKVLAENAIEMPEGGAIPEGYVEWQPEKGNVFYRGQTLPEKLIEQFTEENPYFQEIVDRFSEVTIKGRQKKAYIIPEGVAKTLDNLRTFKSDPMFGAINRKMIGAWKVWTLLSPRRAIKYNLNNMSGDLDAALAADPMIVKYMGDAYRNGWNRMQGRAMSQMDVDMIDRGVLDSGISINEIPDINTLPGFKNLTPARRHVKLWQAIRTGNIKALMPPNLVAKYFDKISAITNFREGLLREAAYRRALELLEQGKEITWASDPRELAAIPDIKDKAAKLSRELLGDYGNISVHGEAIRERYLPFWSWMEINAPRYYRILKNAALEGKGGSTAARVAGVGARKVTGAALGIAEKVVFTQILFATVSAFNHFMFPDEEANLDQKNLHLILGKTTEGKTLSIRFQGAFSDALSWFGLEDYPDIINKMQSGKMDAGDLAKKMLLATPNKIGNAALPYAKLGAELITKKTWYPDINKPRPIRDRAEHAARFLSLENEYRAATGKPSKGYVNSLKNAITYESDPGENAYNTIRSQAFDFMEKKGKPIPQGEPTERSNALYYYKQALRYKDKEAARKYLGEYKRLGGKMSGMLMSVNKSRPLAAVGKYRYEFIKSLSAEDREKLKQAEKWFKSVYGR